MNQPASATWLSPDNAATLQQQTAQLLDMPVRFCDHLADGSAGPVMRVIPPGTFMMGAHKDEYKVQDCEKPKFEVFFNRPFALGETAVTRRWYFRFLHETGYVRPRPYSWDDPELPMYNVCAKDADAFCRWLSEQTGEQYLLPTEAQWEYAARAGTQSLFHFGDKIRREEVNCAGGLHCTKGVFICGLSKPVPVASLPANGFGLYEMHGNVQEITRDHWRDMYPVTPRCGDEPYRSVDEKWKHWRAVRGGSWFHSPGYCRSASRARRHELEFDLNLGFRLLRVLDSQPQTGD